MSRDVIQSLAKFCERALESAASRHGRRWTPLGKLTTHPLFGKGQSFDRVYRTIDELANDPAKKKETFKQFIWLLFHLY